MAGRQLPPISLCVHFGFPFPLAPFVSMCQSGLGKLRFSPKKEASTKIFAVENKQLSYFLLPKHSTAQQACSKSSMVVTALNNY